MNGEVKGCSSCHSSSSLLSSNSLEVLLSPKRGNSHLEKIGFVCCTIMFAGGIAIFVSTFSPRLRQSLLYDRVLSLKVHIISYLLL